MPMGLTRKRAGALGGLAVGCLLATTPVHVQAAEPVKFVLDWKYQGNHAPWGLAIERGYFEREGLAVTMDQGAGSGDAINKVASGAYDIGFADINLLVKFDAENPANRVIAVFVVFERSMNAIVSLKKNHIDAPQDLAGKLIAGSNGDSARLLFPIFARIAGIDAASIRWQTINSQMRAPLLIKNEVDAITGFVSGAVFDLIGAGAKREDIAFLQYSDYGLDLYGNALVTSAAFATKHPDTVRKFIRATIAGERDAIADPEAGVASLKKREPLVDQPLEVDRFKLVLSAAMLTPSVREKGFGTVDMARFSRGAGYVAEAFGVADPPKAEDIYSDAFLPPAAERQVTR
jgi:NitT/TauT family transport system substrate-binding protein